MNLKFFAGTTFVALLGILSVHPAIAQTRPNNNGVGNEQMQPAGRELTTPATSEEGDVNRTQMQMENQSPLNNQMQSPTGDSNQTSPDGLTEQQRSLDRLNVEETQIRRIQTTPIPPRDNVQTQQQFQSQPTRTDTQFNNSVDTTNDAAPVRGLW